MVEHIGPTENNGNRPLVSVIIPCYNHANFLGEAITSVLQQEYRPLEIVVVDDGSTDNTRQVAASYSSTQYVYQPNAGLAAARNKGIATCRGEYVLFLDADDLLCSNALESAMRAMLDNPGCGFVYGEYRQVDQDGTPLDIPGAIHRDDYVGLFLRGNHIGMCATVLYPRRVLEAMGGFRPEFLAGEDYELYLRIARRFPYVGHNAVMAQYRRHTGNMSANPAFMLHWTLSVMRTQREHVKTDPALRHAYAKGIRQWKRWYGGALALKILTCFRRGRITEGIRHTGSLLKLAPDLLIWSAPIIARKATRRIAMSPIPKKIYTQFK
jgi:glycosyltransferase involved in cell wall biosynthesis